MGSLKSQTVFKLFSDCAIAHGFNVRPSTKQEKLNDIDMVIWDASDKTKVFAVAIKNTILKKSKKRKHLWGWVELADRDGNEGWLYKKCTFVIYERKNDFVLIHKNDFKEWIQANNLARWDLPFVKDSWSAAYRLFRRPKTKESIFHLKVADALKNCRHHIWTKPEKAN